MISFAESLELLDASYQQASWTKTPRQGSRWPEVDGEARSINWRREPQFDSSDGGKERLDVWYERESADATNPFPPVFVRAHDANVSAVQRRRPITLPPTRTDRNATAFVTSRTKDTITKLRAMIISAGFRASVPVKALVVSASTDPEEGWTLLSLDVIVNVSEEQALAFWDYLGEVIDTWKRGLPLDEQEDFNTRFSFSVIWE